MCGPPWSHMELIWELSLGSMITYVWDDHGTKLSPRFTSFPSPAGMSLTKLPLGRNNSVMTSLFPPRESLVVTYRLGTGNSRTFFYGEKTWLSCCRCNLPHSFDDTEKMWPSYIILFHEREQYIQYVNCAGLLSYRWWCVLWLCVRVSSVCQSVTDTPTPTKTRWRPEVLVPPTRGGRSENFPDWGGRGGGLLAHQYCQTIFQPFCLTVRFCSS